MKTMSQIMLRLTSFKYYIQTSGPASSVAGKWFVAVVSSVFMALTDACAMNEWNIIISTNS